MMRIEPISALSTPRISANYGQSVTPVRSAKKVDFNDAMVVAVGKKEEESNAFSMSAVQKASQAKARENEKAMNAIASSMQGQNAYYDSAMQGGTYSVVGSMFDAIA